MTMLGEVISRPNDNMMAMMAMKTDEENSNDT